MKREKSAESDVTEESLGSKDTDDEKKLEKAKNSPELKWVHVDRALREDAFKNLSLQKRVILISQCNECRAKRNHHISIPYGPANYLIVINNCKGCLDTNVDIGKVYLRYWPKVEDRAIDRVPRSREG